MSDNSSSYNYRILALHEQELGYFTKPSNKVKVEKNKLFQCNDINDLGVPKFKVRIQDI